jgi:hypothetical protein
MHEHTCRQGNDNCRACFPTRMDKFFAAVDHAMNNSRFLQWLLCAFILSPILGVVAWGMLWLGWSFLIWSPAPIGSLEYRVATIGLVGVFAIMKFAQWLDD